jgi:uncharacterized protein YodC (DUF2158 family)
VNESRYKPGEQVMLQSGGPYMTVERVTGDQISCVWFFENDLKHATFLSPLLRFRSDVEAEHSAAIARNSERLHRINNDW